MIRRRNKKRRTFLTYDEFVEQERKLEWVSQSGMRFIDTSQYTGEANIKHVEESPKMGEGLLSQLNNPVPYTFFTSEKMMQHIDNIVKNYMTDIEEPPKKSTRRRGGRGDDRIMAMEMALEAQKAQQANVEDYFWNKDINPFI